MNEWVKAVVSTAAVLLIVWILAFVAGVGFGILTRAFRLGQSLI